MDTTLLGARLCSASTWLPRWSARGEDALVGEPVPRLTVPTFGEVVGLFQGRFVGDCCILAGLRWNVDDVMLALTASSASFVKNVPFVAGDSFISNELRVRRTILPLIGDAEGFETTCGTICCAGAEVDKTDTGSHSVGSGFRGLADFISPYVIVLFSVMMSILLSEVSWEVSLSESQTLWSELLVEAALLNGPESMSDETVQRSRKWEQLVHIPEGGPSTGRGNIFLCFA